MLKNTLSLLVAILSNVILYAQIPVVQSFSPKSGGTGTIIQIKGNSLNSVTSITFGGVPATSFKIVSNDLIEAVIGAGSSGIIRVTSPEGSIDIAGLTFVKLPEIKSVSTTKIKPGSTVEIKGDNLTGVFEVKFGSVPAKSFYINGSGNVVATVGKGANGNLTLSTLGGTAIYKGITYNETPPVIESFLKSGKVGTNILIKGQGFNNDYTQNLVQFGSVKGLVVAATPMELTVQVPTGITGGHISVTNLETELVGYSMLNFVPTFASLDKIVSSDFSPKVSFEAKSSTGIKVEDFDGDGKGDVFTMNLTNKTISIFQNTAANLSIDLSSYASPITISTGTSPSDFTLGDVNGDGKIDLLFTDQTANTVAIILNQSTPGNIALGQISYFTSGVKPISVMVSDLDLDGRSDLVVGNSGDNTFSVFRNTTTSSTAPLNFERKSWVVPGSPSLVSVLSYRNSGTGPGIAVAYNNAVKFYANTSGIGNINFDVYSDPITSAVRVKRFVFADFNGDNYIDYALIGENSNTVEIFTSDGYRFDAGLKVSVPLTATGTTIDAADLDGDGKVDLAIGYSSGTVLSILRNIGGGNTSPAQSFSKVDIDIASLSTDLKIADADGDGKPDIHFLINNAWAVIKNSPDIKPKSLLAPSIASYSPVSTMAGSIVTLTGSNFNEAIDKNLVFFGSISAIVSSASKTQLTVVVPGSAENSKITVLNLDNKLQGTSSRTFFPSFASARKFTSADLNTPGNTIDLQTTSPDLSTGDLNGDGKSDIIIVNSATNSLTIYPNASANGSFTIGFKFNLITGTNPQQVRIADVNADGKMDIIVANKGSNSISVFINQGQSKLNDASFAGKIDFLTGNAPIGLEVADIDNDGRPDLLSVNVTQNISYLANQYSSGFNASSFATKIDFKSNIGNIKKILIEDLNADGKPEIIAATTTSIAPIFLNTSSPGSAVMIEKSLNLNTSSETMVVGAGDLNGDGKPEIIFGDVPATNFTDAYVYVFGNTSGIDISFAERKELHMNRYSNSSASSFQVIKVVDIDGDSKPDLIAAHNSAISVFRNLYVADGAISLASPVNVQHLATGVLEIADLNLDGKPDLVALNKNTSAMTVLLNRPALPPNINFVTPLFAKPGATVTITGTNFSVNQASNVVNFGAVRGQVTNASVTQLSVTVPHGASNQPLSVANTDVNLIGYASQAFSPIFDSKKTIFTGDFTRVKTVQPGVNSYKELAVGDLDNNGVIDFIASVKDQHAIQVFMNNSTSPTITLGTGYSPEGVTLADLDGDGYLDIISANLIGQTISVFRNNFIANGTFISSINFGYSSQPYRVITGDLDGDGKPEIIVGDWGPQTNLAVYWNKSSVGIINSYSFSKPIAFKTSDGASTLKLGDIDGDGKLDLVTANMLTNSISILRNTITNNTITTGAFASSVDFDVNSSPSGLTIDDFDGDGKPDIAVANEANSTVSIFRNVATPGIINSASLNGRVSFVCGAGPVDIKGGDMDGDGKIDLLVANKGSNSVSILKNIAEPGIIHPNSFLPKVDFSFTTGLNSLMVGDMDNDGLTDFAVLGVQSWGVFKNVRTLDVLPSIASFTPNNVKMGGIVTITGTNFTAVTDVRFGATPAETFTVVSPTTITAKLALGSSGAISVFNGQGAGTIKGFIFDSKPDGTPPKINNFSPAKGSAGTTVTLNGENFSGSLSGNIVYFGGVKAMVLSATTTQVTVKVPVGATYAPLSITTDSRTAYSKKPFVISFDGSVGDFQFTSDSFASRTDFPGSTKPKDAIAADIDGDGKVDLVTLNASSFSVHSNTSKIGEFSFTKAEFSVIANPNHFLIIDLDGDGKLDIAITNSNKSFSVFKNTSVAGAVSFDTRKDFPIGLSVQGIASGDLDLDGKPDLAFTNRDEFKITILKNISTGSVISFLPQPALSVTGNVNDLAIGDIDDDGKSDIMVTNVSNFPAVSGFFNLTTSGEIIFSLGHAADLYSPHYTAVLDKISFGDFNGDDKLDPVISQNGYMTFPINKGTTGNLKVDFSNTYQLYGGSLYHALGDLDGDGLIDVAATLYGSDQISVQRNKSTTGTISISNDVRYTTLANPTGIYLADFDGDGRTDIAVTNSDANSISVFKNSKTNAVSITYFEPVSAAFGQEVTIRGINFLNATDVTFGGKSAKSYKVNSSSSIVATLDDGMSGEIRVVAPYGEATKSGFTYTLAAPTISGFSSKAPFIGEEVTIIGNHFINVSEVKIGGVPASFTIISPTTIKAAIAEGAKTTQSKVVVTTPKGIAEASINAIIERPIINSFTPNVASLGTVITIMGSNFSNATSVKIGGSNVASFIVNSANMITAVLGSGATGEVSITTGGGTVSKTGFSFIGMPTVDVFSPAIANLGKAVTITGSNLDQVSSVSFGGISASSFNIVSSTKIIAVVGTGASGNLLLTGQRGNVSVPGFLYIDVPTLSSFSPAALSVSGTIEINGSNFAGTTGVTIGGIPATSFVILSSTQIRAVVGMAKSGDIAVTTNAGSASLSGFTFIPRPKIIPSGSTTFATGGKVILNINVTGTDYTYKWKKNNVEIPGSSSSSIEVTESGSYTVDVLTGTTTLTSEAIIITSVYTLPTNNFAVKVIGESCRSANDGSIEIAAIKNLNYMAVINGNAAVPYTFSSALRIHPLQAGTYSICITVIGQPDYKQCFDLVITEPKDLSVYAKTSPNNNSIDLQLIGGLTYYIQINNKIFQTSANTINLPLSAGENKLTVKADKECQGLYTQTFYGQATIKAYPNPVDRILTLKIPIITRKNVGVELMTLGGQILLKATYVNNDGVIEIDLEKFKSAIYLLRITTGDGEKSTITIIKR